MSANARPAVGRLAAAKKGGRLAEQLGIAVGRDGAEMAATQVR